MYSKYLHPAWLRGWQKWENQNSNRGLNYCGVRQASWKSILNIKIKCRVGSKSRGRLVRETKIVQLKMMNFPVSRQPFFFFLTFFLPCLLWAWHGITEGKRIYHWALQTWCMWDSDLKRSTCVSVRLFGGNHYGKTTQN